MKRIIRHQHATSEDGVRCIEYLSAALASMLLSKSIHPKLVGREDLIINLKDHVMLCVLIVEIGGVEEVARIAKKSRQSRVLATLGMILVTMVPSPDELYVR